MPELGVRSESRAAEWGPRSFSSLRRRICRYTWVYDRKAGHPAKCRAGLKKDPDSKTKDDLYPPPNGTRRRAGSRQFKGEFCKAGGKGAPPRDFQGSSTWERPPRAAPSDLYSSQIRDDEGQNHRSLGAQRSIYSRALVWTERRRGRKGRRSAGLNGIAAGADPRKTSDDSRHRPGRDQCRQDSEVVPRHKKKSRRPIGPCAESSDKCRSMEGKTEKTFSKVAPLTRGKGDYRVYQEGRKVPVDQLPMQRGQHATGGAEDHMEIF